MIDVIVSLPWTQRNWQFLIVQSGMCHPSRFYCLYKTLKRCNGSLSQCGSLLPDAARVGDFLDLCVSRRLRGRLRLLDVPRDRNWGSFRQSAGAERGRGGHARFGLRVDRNVGIPATRPVDNKPPCRNYC